VGIKPLENNMQSGAYNLLFTREWMLIVPRKQEEFEKISVNSLGFAGALLVKNQQQMQLQQMQHGMNNQIKINETKLNESCHSSDDDHNSSGGGIGERPYKCSQCFKTFRKKVHLNQHCRIHSGEKPYGCDFCEKRFTQLSHLWQHTRCLRELDFFDFFKII
jgi:hypothetical protein